MTSYREAETLLKGKDHKKLGNNTYLVRLSPDEIGVRLHNTIVVKYTNDGKVILNSGGWQTVTTKERMNRYSPVRLWSERGIWFASAWEGDWQTTEAKAVPYADGITFDSTGKYLSGAGTDQSAMLAKLNRMVKTYVKGFAKSVADAKKLEQPSNGDCWPCLMRDANNRKNLEPMGYDHYFAHFEEKYYVPSLLFKAIQAIGYVNPALTYSVLQMEAERGDTSFLKRILFSYFRKIKSKLLEEYLRRSLVSS